MLRRGAKFAVETGLGSQEGKNYNMLAGKELGRGMEGLRGLGTGFASRFSVKARAV